MTAKNWFYYKNNWWQEINLLDEYEKVAILKDGKVITDKIKSIIFKINVDEYNALLRKPKMKIVLRIQDPVLLTFDFNFCYFYASLLLLKV
jgi:hypothetical protein